jgi:hypothetical protein
MQTKKSEIELLEDLIAGKPLAQLSQVEPLMTSVKPAASQPAQVTITDVPSVSAPKVEKALPVETFIPTVSNQALAGQIANIQSEMNRPSALDVSEERARLDDIAQRRRELAGERKDDDLITQAIYSLGPALLGAVAGGTAGSAAALPTYQQTQAQAQQRIGREDAAQKERLAMLDKEEAQASAGIKQKAEQEKLESEMRLKRLAEISKLIIEDTKLSSTEKKDALDEVLRLQDLEIKRANLAMRREEFAGRETTAQKAIETNIGKSIAEYTTKDRSEIMGSATKLDNSLSNIDEAIKTKRPLFGAIRGQVPDIIRNITNPKAVATRESIQDAIKNLLRPTLGAQFTEKEGERVMNFAINPALSDKEAKRRVLIIKKALQEKVKLNDALAAHIQKGGKFSTFDLSKYNFGELAPMIEVSLPGQEPISLDGRKLDVFPRTVTNDKGESAVVNNKKELDEAIGEGFR